MQLSIIIVNYNVKYFLEHCLLSVIKASKNVHAEIFVVDNNSADGSQQYLSNKFQTVHFYWGNENMGFGKANNYVLPFAKGEYILFLNPDTIVPEDCFTNCISFFQSHKDCGALGVRMIDGAGNFLKESKRSLPTPAAGFFKMIGLAEIFPSSKIFAQYYAGHLPEKIHNKVDVLAGAFMMLSKKAVELTKGFDESFFMYGEDIDLSYRIQKAGLQNYYLGETTIIHFKGESTQKKSANYIRHFYGAIKRFVNKHYSKQSLKKLLMNTVISCGMVFAKMKNIFTKKMKNKNHPINCIYLGNETQLDSVNEIIKMSGIKITASTNCLENLRELLEKHNPHAIIFSEENLSNKILIENLSFIHSKKLALFYQTGAASIIGSNDKNKRGVFIAKQ
jgi:GT2 family glycosyltransferase